MAEYLADTNIFIAIMKGDASAADLVDNLKASIDSIVYLELIQGSKNKKEVSQIEAFLSGVVLIHFDQAISIRAIGPVKAYSKSHGLMFPDAIVAATCLENDLTLITRNMKDFRFIESLKLYKGSV